MDEIFGRGSSKEIEKATTTEKIIERIEELSKREEQFDKWEQMRQEARRKQREDRRLNIFWWRKRASLPSLEMTRLQMPKKRWSFGKASTTKK